MPDQSGSMFGAFGDPTGVTAAAAESVLDLLHRSGGGSASVIPWGSDAPARLAAGPLDIRKDLKRLSTALRNGENLGGNDLAAALRRAKLLTPALGPDHQVVYCVITYGIQDATPAIHAAVGDLAPGWVHVPRRPQRRSHRSHGRRLGHGAVRLEHHARRLRHHRDDRTRRRHRHHPGPDGPGHHPGRSKK